MSARLWSVATMLAALMLGGSISASASEASSTVNTKFYGTATREDFCPISGPYCYGWTFDAVGTGPSPTVATMKVAYGQIEGPITSADFFLDDHSGDTLTGLAQSTTSDSHLVGQVTAATGRYTPDVNKMAIVDIQIPRTVSVGQCYPDCSYGLTEVVGTLQVP
jgi:hypothetical protein